MERLVIIFFFALRAAAVGGLVTGQNGRTVAGKFRWWTGSSDEPLASLRPSPETGVDNLHQPKFRKGLYGVLTGRHSAAIHFVLVTIEILIHHFGKSGQQPVLAVRHVEIP
jgi:hypothetical protein